ncbi:winged helix-turn-helix transcriptional regulator [Baekduia soli]|uniref:Winged helix-turn-helix transcriptional regulator n=2 Tax=Baekduia soli TaxID=496014 RepID=A0A5B8UCK1_9ACTN|nr:winged helix-turn-helix transcriptional regulator [Baekduia soli]
MTTLEVVDARGYAQLASLRSGIRNYLAWAEQQAREHDMTPAQVQLALAIRAHGDPDGPTVGELADTLLLRHHSAVGLIDRAEHAGLVARHRDPEHQSRVRVRLTTEGDDRLERLSALHLQWLAEHGAEMADVWRAFGPEAR